MGIKELLKRGQVWLVCLDPTVGAEIKKTRPAIIISNDINNRFSQTVSIIPITSNVNKIFPFEVALLAGNAGLVQNSKAKCDQIRTVDKKRLVKKLGKISEEKIKEIENALLIHFGMY